MEKLHGIISQNAEWYAKWHQYPNHQFHHWIFFLVIVVATTASILSGISSYASGEDANASTILQITHKQVQSPSFKVKEDFFTPASDHILVKFKNSVSQTKRKEILSKHGFSEKSEIKALGIKLISITNANTPEEAVQKLKVQNQKDIDFVEVDGNITIQAIPNDPKYPSEWYLPQISAPSAWNISTGSPGVIIAMIDTGLNPINLELSSKLVQGWNFITGNNTIADSHGHGTATALVAAAIANNNYNGAGVAWNNKIMPLVVCDSTGFCSWSNVASAITWAADHGAKVINMSIAGSVDSSAMQSATNYAWSKGLVIVGAAGNSSTNTPYYPAAEQNVIGVSATCDTNNTLASFSNYGNYIDLAAPGCNINGSNGTSFSAPIVTGVAALVFSANTALTNEQVVSILQNNVDDVGVTGWDQNYGYGLVNALKAVTTAINYVETSDTSAPSTPVILSAFATSDKNVTISWKASNDNVGVAGYYIYRNGVKIGTSGSTTYNDSTTLGTTSYTYYILAYDAAGNISSQSNQIIVVTPQTSVAITSFQVSNKTANSATITWTTNIPSTGILQYGLIKNALSQSITDTVISTSHKALLQNLNNSTTYYYKISATSQDTSSVSVITTSSFRTTKK